MTLLKRPILISTATAAIAFVSLFLLESARGFSARRELSEAGWIESVSAALWFIAAGIAAIAAIRRRDVRADLLLMGYVWLIFGARELDWHKRFTSWNIEQAIKLTKDYIPLSQRIAVFVFLWLPIVTAVVLIFTRWRRWFTAAVRAGKRWPLGVMWWVILIAGSRIADKLSGFVPRQEWIPRGAEESLELALVVLTVLMLGQVAMKSEG